MEMRYKNVLKILECFLLLTFAAARKFNNVETTNLRAIELKF